MWQRNDDWLGSQVDDSFVMINVEDGAYVALNATAASAWELLAEPCDEDGLATAMTARFSVDRDHCLVAVRTLLDTMIARNLVRSVP